MLPQSWLGQQMQFDRLKRRKFITLLGGAAAAWPLAARAQERRAVRRGYLDGGAGVDPTSQNLRRQFVLGMRDLGYNEGRDYVLDERYAAGRMERFEGFAKELVGFQSRSSWPVARRRSGPP